MKTDNELIAEFMGKFGLWFHTSWDWLMPVVEKIDKMQLFDVVEYRELSELGIFADKQTIRMHVISFIKWYNQKNLK
jgi:hypothetical protein